MTTKTGGPEKPCTCPRSDHPHGSVQRYQADGCRCTPCSRAVVRYNKGLRAGHRLMVPPDRAVAHIADLRARGMSLDLVSRASGVAVATLLKLGDRTLIRPGTEAKVLAVRPAVHPGRMVPAWRAVRRLQALACLGWSSGTLAPRLGVSKSTVIALTAGAWEVRADTWLAVRRLYDELWDHPAPQGHDRVTRSARARVVAHARRQGWAPPAAWDDIDRDEAPAPGWDAADPAVAAAAERERAKKDRRNVTARANRAARAEGVAA